MMKTIVRKPTKTIFYGAALAAVALVIALLAASYAAGPARAQTSGNTYPNPQPCGPSADTAFMEEPHEVTSGHFALFEAYWAWTDVLGDDAEDTGVLHTNLCPPLVTITREDNFGVITETTTRSARKGGMDVEEAIMHVKDTHTADVVATNAEVTDGELSLAEYPGVRDALGLGKDDPVATGTQVWWLQLDDPDTTANEKSDMSLGFSTLLLDRNYWHRTGTDSAGNPHKPLRYKFLVERYPAGPGSPEEVPHFLAYEAPKVGGAEATLVWDSTKPSVEQTDVVMDPGEFHALQWVFTKPGTYLLWVELQGYVREKNPLQSIDPNYDPNWKPVSAGETVTSEVYRYTIQVGETLDELEPPIFGVNLKVDENSPGGVKVGDPIPVYNAEADVLYYDLVDRETRKKSAEFELAKSTSTAPHTVQVVVKDGASLDFETTPSYELELSVADKLDHESNKRPNELHYPDDILIVRIDLEDQDPGMVLEIDNEFPAVGEAVNFVARYEPTPEQLGRTFAYEWAEMIQTKHDGVKHHVISSAPNAPTWSVAQSSAGTRTYQVRVVLDGGTDTITVHSKDVPIFWGL